MLLVVAFLSPCFSKACNVLDTDPAQFTPDVNDAGLLYCTILWIMFFKKASHLLIMPFFIIQSWKGLFSVPCVCEQQRDGGEGHEDADGDAGEEGAECGGVVADTLVVQTYFMSLED